VKYHLCKDLIISPTAKKKGRYVSIGSQSLIFYRRTRVTLFALKSRRPLLKSRRPLLKSRLLRQQKSLRRQQRLKLRLLRTRKLIRKLRLMVKPSPMLGLLTAIPQVNKHKDRECVLLPTHIYIGVTDGSVECCVGFFFFFAHPLGGPLKGSSYLSATQSHQQTHLNG
jgi:hypothetical protein